MKKESTKYFIDNTISFSIILLRSVYKEEGELIPHSPMDFHIHVLYYKDPELNHVGGICLDTSDIQIFPYSGEDFHEVTQNIGLDIARLFIDKIRSMMKANKYDSKLLFNRADEELWKFFNVIKAETFLANIKGFAEYVKAKTVNIIDDAPILRPDDEYKNFEIWLSEERNVGDELKSLASSG